MIKLPIDEFIFEVKEEILSYEELGEKKANEWENNFIKWLKDENIKKKYVKGNGEKKFYEIKDESVIFEIADRYYDSVLQKKEDLYWSKFQ